MTIKELCQTHTKLSSSDIKKLEEIAMSMQYMADLGQTDVFIDCMTRDKNIAIVVFESKPTSSPSIYKDSFLGLLILRKNEPAVLRTLEIGVPSFDIVATTKIDIKVQQNVIPIRNDNGKIIGVLIMEKKIINSTNFFVNSKNETTKEINADLISKKDKNKYDLAGSLTDGILVFDKNGIAIYANLIAKELYEKLGYTGGILGMHFNNLVLESINYETILKNKINKQSDITIGKLSLCIKYSLNKSKIAMIMTDVTDIKEKDKQLSLNSHSLREIHHRVKNNLQTVASLLNLQSRRVSDEKVKMLLNENINRILSIAITHEILAKNGVDSVDLKTILNNIKTNMNIDDNIIILVEGDSLLVNSSISTSIALIVNELLQNSVKHAFVKREKGKIIVHIQKGVMFSNISVIDDGVGFDFKNLSKSSLGLSIVKNIVKDKFSGNVTIESGECGTTVMFDFNHMGKF